MAGKDPPGTYDTNDYTLGRGIMYLSEIDSTTGLPKEWRDVGNVPDFTVNVAEEELEHFTSRTGLKTRDKTVTLSKDLQMAFSFDTINDQNLALFLSGETANYTNAAVAGFAEWQVIGDGDIPASPQLVWYRIESSAAARAYGITSTNLTVATTNATPVTLVEGTDYEVLESSGMFRLLDSTAVQLAITNVEGITIELAADAGAVNMDEVRGLTKSTVSVAMMFQAVNPANDDEPTEFVFHQVKLRADGDMNLIGDDWTQMPFGGTVESNTKASPNSPHVTIRTPKAA
jgi:hypothetical protein